MSESRVRPVAGAGDTIRKATKQRKPGGSASDTPISAPAAAPARAKAHAAVSPAPSPALRADTIEAAPSPAVASDPIPGPAADAAPINEDIITMATIAPPTSPNDAADKAQAMFGEVSTRMKASLEKSSKVGEEIADFAKGNVEAVIASARVAAKAGESLGQEAADYGRKSFESASAAFKSFATVKSPTELFQLQSEFAKTSFDTAIAEASRLSETIMKLAGDIAQPLSNRYALAAEKFKTTAL